MKKIALLFSGQGAQAVGMGKALAEAYPAVAALFKKFFGKKTPEIR